MHSRKTVPREWNALPDWIGLAQLYTLPVMSKIGAEFRRMLWSVAPGI